MAKKPIKPLIRALTEHIADEVIAAHDAKLPRRKRLPKDFYERELAAEDPRIKQGAKHVKSEEKPK